MMQMLTNAVRRERAMPLLFALVAGAASALLTGWLLTRGGEFLDLDIARANPLFVVAGLAVFALVVRFPEIDLPLLIAFVYLNLSQVLVRWHGMPSLLQLLVIPLFLVAVFGRGSRQGRVALQQPLTLVLAAFWLVQLFTTSFAADRSLADDRIAESLKGFVIFVLALMLASSGERVRRGAWALVGSAAFLSVFPLYQFLTGNFGNEFGGLARIKRAQIWGDVFEPRVAGPLGDPNFFAQILLIAIPIAFFVALSSPSRRARLVALLMLALITTATLMTYSRGAVLALAFMAVFTLVILGVDWKKIAAAGAIGFVALMLLPIGFIERMATIAQVVPGAEEVEDPDSSFEKRRLLTTVAWKMYLDHPVIGVGVGNYTVEFDQYADDVGSAARDYEDPFEAHFPHNLYLEIAAETGTVGLVLFVTAIAIAFANLDSARRRFSAAGMGELASIAVAFEVALAGFLASSLFLHGHYQRYLWLLLAFAPALRSIARRGRESSDAAG